MNYIINEIEKFYYSLTFLTIMYYYCLINKIATYQVLLLKICEHKNKCCQRYLTRREGIERDLKLNSRIFYFPRNPCISQNVLSLTERSESCMRKINSLVAVEEEVARQIVYPIFSTKNQGFFAEDDSCGVRDTSI